MMPSFILSVCFAFLKKLPSSSPLMALSSYKMDVVITALVFIVLTVGCMGSDPEETNLTPDNKRKIFDIFNKTFTHEGDHARQMKKQWNEENPSQKVSDRRKLYKLAWDVIGDNCRDSKRQTQVSRKRTRKALSQIHREIEGDNPEDRRLMHETLLSRHPEYRNLSRDLTWSLVHDWHRYYAEDVVPRNMTEWTGVMTASLQYIRDEVRKEQKENRDEIKRRWILLYPKYRIRSTSLEHNLKELDAIGFRSTTENMRKAKERYNTLYTLMEGREKRKHQKWTHQMQADLLYIATNLDARDKLFNQKLKTQWDQMHKTYHFLNKMSLVRRLYKMKKEQNFKLRPKHVRRAKIRYDKITPVDEGPPEYAPTRQPDVLDKFLAENRKKIQKLLGNIDIHVTSGHNTESSPSSSQHSHSEHSPEETSPSHKYDQPELTRNLSAPIHSQASFPEFDHLPDYGIRHYPNISGYEVGGSSSTPRPSHSGRSPGGGPSAPHQYQHPEFQQNLSAPIYSPPLLPEFGYSPDYGMHYHLNISGHDTQAPPPTPRSSRSDRPREGGTSSSHEYQQPSFSQDPSALIHSPRAPTEFRLPPGYSTQTSSSDPTLNPQSNTPRPRGREGSSMSKTQGRRP